MASIISVEMCGIHLTIDTAKRSERRKIKFTILHPVNGGEKKTETLSKLKQITVLHHRNLLFILLWWWNKTATVGTADL